METRDGLHNFRKQGKKCSVNKEKVLCCFYKIILKKLCANLKRYNRVYILSSKHTYRPMRARVVAQLFL